MKKDDVVKSISFNLPVVDELGRPVGVLSVKRIVHYLAEHFPGLVYNQPPDPSRFPEEAEGP